MSALGRPLRRTLALFAFATAVLLPAVAGAQDADSSTRDAAAKHFQRGVALYGEADYRASLVEFKRAYALAPNAAVLYNVGETEYQLQDYASALTTFRRYLGESAATDPHHAEVENDIEVLRARVGHVRISTLPPGADVTIDDQLVGKTPLDEPVLVSIGHRKVIATIAGRPPVSRYVDVPAEDNVAVALTLPAFVNPEAVQPFGPVLSSGASKGSNGAGPALRVAGWIATAAFTGGAVTFGLLANKASTDLRKARNSFPTTTAMLNHDASLATTYSVVADSLTVAAVIVGGITLFSTLSSSNASSSMRGAAGETRVSLGPSSARLDVTF